MSTTQIKRTSTLKRTSVRKNKAPQRDCLWWCLSIYASEEKERLVFKRLYRTSKQVAEDNPAIFNSYQQVLNFRKRHCNDCKVKTRLMSKNNLLRQITITRDVFDFENPQIAKSLHVKIRELKSYKKLKKEKKTKSNLKSTV